MQIITMKISELVKPEKNIRLHTSNQLKEFERSVKMFGQIRPIVIDENNVILAGNGLYETLINMGAETAEVYKYENLTENQKKKLMIADNKIFSLGVDNLETLNSIIEDLSDDLDIPGFDEDILKQMVSDSDVVTEKLSEYGTLDEEQIQTIKENAIKKEERINTIQKTRAESTYNEPNTSENTEESITEDIEPNTVNKFVICPKCGEKIWL